MINLTALVFCYGVYKLKWKYVFFLIVDAVDVYKSIPMRLYLRQCKAISNVVKEPLRNEPAGRINKARESEREINWTLMIYHLLHNDCLNFLECQSESHNTVPYNLQWTERSANRFVMDVKDFDCVFRWDCAALTVWGRVFAVSLWLIVPSANIGVNGKYNVGITTSPIKLPTTIKPK